MLEVASAALTVIPAWWLNPVRALALYPDEVGAVCGPGNVDLFTGNYQSQPDVSAGFRVADGKSAVDHCVNGDRFDIHCALSGVWCTIAAVCRGMVERSCSLY